MGAGVVLGGGPPYRWGRSAGFRPPKVKGQFAEDRDSTAEKCWQRKFGERF